MDNKERHPSEIEKRNAEQHSQKKSAASLCGIFNDVAKPEMIPLEEGAWERDIVERIKNGDDSF